MSDEAPPCGIVNDMTISRDPDQVDTGEFQASATAYRLIDSGYDETFLRNADDCPTKDEGLDDDTAKQIDEYASTLEETSASLNEETAPDWFRRGTGDNR